VSAHRLILYGLRPYPDSGISRTYGTVGVVTVIRFYPDVVPNGTRFPNHYQHYFADGVEQVFCDLSGIDELLPDASKECDQSSVSF
jgi:hypothetical protein